MTSLPDDLSEFLDSVVAVVVATSDDDLKPEVTRGWGMRVLDDGLSVSVSIDRVRSHRTLENLRANARIAVACIRPDFVARQLKGRCSDFASPSDEDESKIERHHQLYIEKAAEFAVPLEVIRHHWSDDVITLHCRIDEVFDQTPGPQAGRAL